MDVIQAIETAHGKATLHLHRGDKRVIPAGMLRLRPLREGDVIDLDDYDAWLRINAYQPALEYAVKYLALRMRSEDEIARRLQQYAYPEMTIARVMATLREKHLVSDSDFAQQWVQMRQRHGIGASRLKQEMRQKGIDEETASAALQSLDEEETLMQAVRLAKKAWQLRKPQEDKRKACQRIMQRLQRRGFSHDMIHKAIDQATHDE